MTSKYAYDTLVLTIGKLVNTLDKEEFRIKLEEINRLVEKKNYKDAMEVVDSIDWRRVKNVRTLCVVGEIYAANKRYEDSKEIFLLAYHRAPIGKNILYRLIEVSLRMKDIQEAEEFYEEFLEIAPNDSTRYILNYKISKEKQVPLEQQIRILEEYKEKEFTERWSYELAKLYYQNGDTEKCLDLCNEMVLWFNDGNYVMKALDLKQRMGVLTGEEKEKYEEQFIPKLIPPEKAQEIKESRENAVDTEYKENRLVTDTIPVDDERDLNSAETIQEKISKGFRDIFGGHKKEEEDEDSEEALQKKVADAEAAASEESEEESDKEPVVTEEALNETETEVAEAEEEIQESEEPEKMPETGVDNLTSGTVELMKESEIQNEQDEEEEVYEEAEEAETEKVTEKELSRSVAEIMNESDEEEKDSGVPLNEEGKPDFSATIRMPELKIPKSMINVDPDNASSSADLPDSSGIFGSIDEIAASVGEKSDSDKKEFNLEDTILAAATEQGIKIPEENKVAHTADNAEEDDDLDLAGDEFVPDEPDAADIEDIMAEISAQKESDAEDADWQSVPDIVYDEDEEPVTEEDLQAAEAEFLNGPSGVQKHSAEENADESVTVAEDEVPLEEEEEYSGDDFTSGEDQEDDDFVSDMVYDEDQDDDEELSEEEQIEKFIETIQPEKDQNKIISRKRLLTDEEKQLFTYFVAVPGMKEQLLDVLCDVQKGAADRTSRTGNVIVMGGRETGKTRLISSLIPAICKELNIEASKVAYIFAEDLNGKDIEEIAAKLAGGFLVIENANQLSQETAAELEEVMNGNTKGMIVILEDEKIGMRKLIARYPKLAKKFTSMINIPVFTNDELVNFAKVYTMENGFRIDQMGMLALYNLIGINQKEDQPMCIGTVKKMLDDAMTRAQSGLFKRSKKRVDRDGYTVLLEKDFS